MRGMQNSCTRADSTRKSSSSARPSKTLFVINTRTRDIEKYFEHYGKISEGTLRLCTEWENYPTLPYFAASSWIELNMQSGTMMTKEMGTAMMEEDVTSPYQRDRGSPDYGHGSVPNSRSEPRGSPQYGRAESPANDRYNSRSPPPPK
ncbi:hypothetical protein SASPL_152856 [Salvia splendens]|uniref:RRM domain-containing protein n=1 Tax=Salvia splendens TaxID=180675 RepID=A0A8X8W4F7_SALSN|nr:hypothetical protein SASPL_152856 [Salvia splendens]